MKASPALRLMVVSSMGVMFIAAATGGCSGTSTSGVFGDHDAAPAGGDAALPPVTGEAGTGFDAGTRPQEAGPPVIEAGPPASCGPGLVGPLWKESCQQWLDQNCCSEQLSCANDPTCYAVLTCINGCPAGPNRTACGDNCVRNGVPPQIGVIADCSHTTSSQTGQKIPTGCKWPDG